LNALNDRWQWHECLVEAAAEHVIVGAGERQGSGKPTKTGSTLAVVPGAVSALVKAGVGGFWRVLAEAISILGEAARHMFRSRTCCDLIKFVI